jgi:hypothetical protein
MTEFPARSLLNTVCHTARTRYRSFGQCNQEPETDRIGHWPSRFCANIPFTVFPAMNPILTGRLTQHLAPSPSAPGHE